MISLNVVKIVISFPNVVVVVLDSQSGFTVNSYCAFTILLFKISCGETIGGPFLIHVEWQKLFFELHDEGVLHVLDGSSINADVKSFSQWLLDDITDGIDWNLHQWA